jgi:hypothetical protein
MSMKIGSKCLMNALPRSVSNHGVTRVTGGVDPVAQLQSWRCGLVVLGFGISLSSKELLSRSFEDSAQARHVNEALDQFWVVFPARDQPAKVVEPAERTLRTIPPLVAPQRATVVGRRPGAVLAVRADHQDAGSASDSRSQSVSAALSYNKRWGLRRVSRSSTGDSIDCSSLATAADRPGGRRSQAIGSPRVGDWGPSWNLCDSTADAAATAPG